MKLTVSPTNSLKESLLAKGFLFPCGGKGLCGRCRVIAPTLPETALDARFLTAAERAAGWRLACDKSVTAPTELDCRLPLGTRTKVEEPWVCVLLGGSSAQIALLDGAEEAERLVLPLPPTADGGTLLATIQKNSIELFERHGVAKAVTVGIFATHARLGALYPDLDGGAGESYDAALLRLPSEEGYLAPTLPTAPAPLLAAAALTGQNVVWADAGCLYLLAPTSVPKAAALVCDCPYPLSHILHAATVTLAPGAQWVAFGDPLPTLPNVTRNPEDLLALLSRAQCTRRNRAAMQRLASSLTPVTLAHEERFLNALH